MATQATYLKDGRKAIAELITKVAGAATPATLGKLLKVQVGNGAAPEFTDPANPPAVDPDDVALRGVLLAENSTPTIEYLVPAPGTGALLYDGAEYDVSASPTDLVLYTWVFTTAQAVGEWREVMWFFSLSNRAFMKLHPRGTASGWQAKTNAEERPIRFLLEL